MAILSWQLHAKRTLKCRTCILPEVNLELAKYELVSLIYRNICKICICNFKTTVFVVSNLIQSLHTCGKNMPLIQCTGGVLPKLSQRTSFLYITNKSHAEDSSEAGRCQKNSSKILTFIYIYTKMYTSRCDSMLCMAVMFSQGAHSSSGKMLHEQWCLGTSLCQDASMLHHAHPGPGVISFVQNWPDALLNGFSDNGPFLDLEYHSGWKWKNYVFHMHITWFFAFPWTSAGHAAPHFDFHKGKRTK